MPPIDFDRAVAYVREYGDEFDQMRVNTLLGNDSLPSREQRERFLAGQPGDGGWASEDGPERDPYVTTQALRALARWRCDLSR